MKWVREDEFYAGDSFNRCGEIAYCTTDSAFSADSTSLNCNNVMINGDALASSTGKRDCCDVQFTIAPDSVSKIGFSAATITDAIDALQASIKRLEEAVFVNKNSQYNALKGIRSRLKTLDVKHEVL